MLNFYAEPRVRDQLRETDEHVTEEARTNFDGDDEEPRLVGAWVFAMSVYASVLHRTSPAWLKRLTSRPWRLVAKTHTLLDAIPQYILPQARTSLRWASSRAVIVTSASEARTAVFYLYIFDRSLT